MTTATTTPPRTTAVPLAGADPATLADRLVTRLARAWNAGDGEAFASAYAPDATFVNIRGEHFRGRDVVAAGHAGIFATIYRGSHTTMQVVESRLLTDDTALVVIRSTLRAPTGPLKGTHSSRMTHVLVRHTDGTWLVAASHNTLEEG
ncbi:SgcJ/EcaC family oxidoreductase [Phycicoccus avicenniae]|uniref:SgcJ/EcaC family oxidoreductase n=1 Tax=Phycicoccus avicenniae TaxID=2828860 RepID=UPI003D2C4BA3